MNEPLDFYCERCSCEFWAEPINAISNVSFLVAAWLAYRVAQRRSSLRWPVGFLIAMAVVVGVGSFVFHTFATRWAQYADIGPIFVFQLYFFWFYLTVVVGWARRVAAMFGVAFLVINILALRSPSMLNGSMMYAPSYVLLLLFTAYHHMKEKPGTRWTTHLAASFTVSLCFRTIDMAVCPYFPIGTHFLWHLVNGFVLFAAIMVVTNSVPAKDAKQVLL